MSPPRGAGKAGKGSNGARGSGGKATGGGKAASGGGKGSRGGRTSDAAGGSSRGRSGASGERARPAASRGSGTGRGATAVRGTGVGTGASGAPRSRTASGATGLRGQGPRVGDPTRARDEPRGLGGEQVEGRRAVRELLAVGRRSVREIWIAEGLDPSPQLDEIERLAIRRRVKVVLAARRRLEATAKTDAPQGVLAFAQPLEEADFDDLCRSTRNGAPFLLVLDGVSDPHNLGSLLRVAEVAGVTGVVLPRHRAANVTATVTKVAAGAIEHLPIAVVPGIPAALRRMDELGVWAIGLDADATRSVYKLGEALAVGPIALVLGAEGRGLADLTRRRCADLVGIPQHGQVASLNVATAGAVACFEIARRRLP